MEQRFVFETTQGAVLEAAEEAALMDHVRVRSNAARPCALTALLVLGFTGYFLLQQDWQSALYTVLVGIPITGFFWLPMIQRKRFRDSIRAARASRDNLTDTVRSKPMRFIFENGGCKMLDGKGAVVQQWDDLRMTGEIRESDWLFWLPAGDTSILLPKRDLKEGAEADFRVWLRAHGKRYRFCKVTDRLRRSVDER